MTTLQDDILEIYNLLVKFNKTTLIDSYPLPIKVSYETAWSAGRRGFLVFEQRGITIKTIIPSFYSLDLLDLEKRPGYLLPEDYDVLMYNLKAAIESGKLLEDRTCLSPMPYGFDIYSADIKQVLKGPEILSSVRFISGNSWVFNLWVRLRYKFRKEDMNTTMPGSIVTAMDNPAVVAPNSDVNVFNVLAK